MGTRNLTVVVSDKETKVAQYCQWDGYPEGQGKTVLEFLRTADLKKFKEKLKGVSFLKTDAELYAIIKKKCKINISKNDGWLNSDESNKIKESLPQLHRDSGPKVLELIYEGIATTLQNDINFAKDSLFCEWCYVIDLDKKTFEVYKGFNKKRLTKKDRFYFDGFNDEYYPVKLAKIYKLDKLPTLKKFIADFKED